MRKILLPLFLLGTIAMMFVMAKTGAALKTAATPKGIINLEFAYNTQRTSVILDAWAPTAGNDIIAAAKTNTGYDFLFIFFYAGLLFFASKKMAESISGPVAKAGNIIAKAALFAGFFDVLENCGMLITLNDHGSSTVAFGTTFFSVIKWSLVAIALLYVLTGLLVLAYQKIRK